MNKIATSTLIVLCFHVFTSTLIADEIHYFGGYQLLGFPVGGEGQITGNLSVNGSSSVSSSTQWPEDITPDGHIIWRTAAFESSLQWKGLNGSVGLGLTGTAQGGWAYSPAAGGTAVISFQDTVRLVWKGDGIPADIPGTKMHVTLLPEGSISAEIGKEPWSGGEHSYARAEVSVQVGLDSFNYLISKNAVLGQFPANPVTVFPTVSGAFSIYPDNRVDFSYSLRVGVNVTVGNGKSLFGNTLTPIAMTFDNGQTPESLGYELVFDSGMTSPNIAAVPEPSSFALLGLGGIGSAFAAYRRRRSAV